MTIGNSCSLITFLLLLVSLNLTGSKKYCSHLASNEAMTIYFTFRNSGEGSKNHDYKLQQLLLTQLNTDRSKRQPCNEAG